MSPAYPFPDKAGIEPSLKDLLEDQTLGTLLAYDRLSVADLRKVIADWRATHSLNTLGLSGAV